MFEHAPNLKLDREAVGRQGEVFRDIMRKISSPEDYLALPPETRCNIAACILNKTKAITPNMGIEHRARNYIPSETESLFARGHEISVQGTVTDIKASYYDPQPTPKDYKGFGKQPAIRVFARERALGAIGKGTAGPWHAVSRVDFDPTIVADFNTESPELVGDTFYGTPSIVLLAEGIDIYAVKTYSQEAEETIDAIDRISLACLSPQLVQTHELGSLAVLHELPDQLAS